MTLHSVPLTSLTSRKSIMTRTVADLIVETLKNAGIRRVYGLSGDSLNGFTDALRRDGDVAWPHVRHEEAAAFAAAGEAAMTGELAVCAAHRRPLHPQFVAKVIDDLAAEDAVFLPDVGTPVIWAARYLRMNGRRRLIGSFSHGTMANAVPQAIGVQSSHPERQVVTLSGDGGLAMNCSTWLTPMCHGGCFLDRPIS